MIQGDKKGRRTRRVASVIRQIVSESLITGLSDPRLAFVTVTGVDVSADMRFADVRVSVMGDDKKQKECMRGIQHAHGRLQESVADALDVKFCPVLRFHLDQSVKRSITISTLIAKARAEDEAARAERIRRGVERPEDAPPEFEEAEPVLEDDEEQNAEEDAGTDETDDEDLDAHEDEQDDAEGGEREGGAHEDGDDADQQDRRRRPPPRR
jgi:ribosome-binding factor A